MDLRPIASLFYVVQFDRQLSDSIDRIAQRVTTGTAAGFTRDELMALLDRALESPESLSQFDMSPFKRTEEAIREFLETLRARLKMVKG